MTYLKSLWWWFCGILGIHKSMENPAKVLAKVKELNGGETGHWLAIPGYHALTKVELNQGNANFFPGTGVILKVFVNGRTGEIRIFPAPMFEGN